MVGIHLADVVSRIQSLFHEGVRPARNRQEQGVEEVLVFYGDAGFRESLVQAFRFPVDFRADALEAFLPVVNSVEGGHDGQEDLGGADVGSGLVPADVLFPRLESQAVGRASLRVYGHADEASGHAAL